MIIPIYIKKTFIEYYFITFYLSIIISRVYVLCKYKNRTKQTEMFLNQFAFCCSRTFLNKTIKNVMSQRNIMNFDQNNL